MAEITTEEKKKKPSASYSKNDIVKTQMLRLPGLTTSHGSTTVSFVTTLNRFPWELKVGKVSGSGVGCFGEANPVGKKKNQLQLKI